jgi:hypothetical protein
MVSHGGPTNRQLLNVTQFELSDSHGIVVMEMTVEEA